MTRLRTIMRKALAYIVTLPVVLVAAAAARAQGLPAAAQQAAPPPCSQPADAASGAAASAAPMNLILFRLLPVQYGGRIMPVDTLTREVVWEVTGQRTWGDLYPAELLLAWTWSWPKWQHEPMILVGNPDLQRHLGLPADRKSFCFADLADRPVLLSLVTQAQRLRQAGLPAHPLQQAALQVWERIRVLNAVRHGTLLRIVPALDDTRGTWVIVADVDSQSGIPADKQEQIRLHWQRMGAAFLARDRGGFIAATYRLDQTLTGLKAASWPNRDTLAWEFVYNLARPFHWGWIATFLAMAAGLVAIAWPTKWIKAIAWTLLLDGFALLTAGILIRWRFSGQTPLATMYETLVFMGWGVAAIGIFIMILVRQRAALPIVAGIATAILVVADTAGLTSTVSPLQPVLRNTIWLIWHVLTVMIGYSAFALAMGVGHVLAASLAYKPQKPESMDSLDRLLYGIILVGCVFLTAGIIFGAIWASASWGRYWGWDPKETWSLITLLGYMVVLHGRRAGWFGPFGEAIASICCFQLVVMTYYGVNFVLGAGLHSYGFSSGGKTWVGLYVLAELLFALWVCRQYARNTGRRPAVA
jgi:cytochrome c-type biogenesis protein CcsB